MTVGNVVRTVAHGRAAQELALKREEFDLAVHMGHVRTVPGAHGQPCRVAQEEIDRLRGAPDFPDGLRERVRMVGTAEGAALASITADRFTRLARTGHFSPVRFYLNRYRAIVWLYPAADVRDFAARHPHLLKGRLPRSLRDALDAGEDVRPRNWRTRRLGLLLRQADDPWAGAAAIASLLDPVQLAEVVDDPYERAYLDRLRPEPPHARTASVALREISDRLLRANDPDEILWHRLSLALAMDEARAVRQAPGPDGGARPPMPMPTPRATVGRGARRAGLLARLRPAWRVQPRPGPRPGRRDHARPGAGPSV
ncbi:DUF6397 family protein [Streptomyces sp. SP18CS02]|uniref:DUF6397 family protein n=1 Tax=Streptomyces sp. SP18CS02 TaxID=3002531 RepID=UPI002E79B743|nr:DUF6397 family protein [Streptomyces sp. SP18CS02]MEE1757489.1 DUF6397 family protein [Streptomyces sp. SP18CS02]